MLQMTSVKQAEENVLLNMCSTLIAACVDAHKDSTLQLQVCVTGTEV